MATVRDLLDGAVARLRESGSESARLDAELLLGYALDTDRTAVIAHTDAPVGDGAAARFAALLERRSAGEPVAYIRGVKEFHGLAFGVDPRALIPRPETELLVQLAELEIVRGLIGAPRAIGAPQIRVIDVGTGSGAIAVTLSVLLRNRGMGDDVAITATDASDEALQLARENAVAHAVGDRIEFQTADLLPTTATPPWEVVLANLPYVPSAVVPALPVAASFEPVAALDGGPDGLRVISRLLGQLRVGLAGDGAALLEIGGDQGDGIGTLVAERLPGWSCELERDLGGLPRVAIVRRVGLRAPA
jgi:release factor glutamine methyltransferase